MSWNLVGEITPCICKAFDSCPYKETDDELCEICLMDSIVHLKKCLRKLHRSMRKLKDGESRLSNDR